MACPLCAALPLLSNRPRECKNLSGCIIPDIWYYGDGMNSSLSTPTPEVMRAIDQDARAAKNRKKTMLIVAGTALDTPDAKASCQKLAESCSMVVWLNFARPPKALYTAEKLVWIQSDMQHFAKLVLSRWSQSANQSDSRGVQDI